MKILLTLLTVLMLTGCDNPFNPECRYRADQVLRAELFEKCMNLLPAGPDETVYNDWAEVVKECDNTAYWQSKREICRTD